MSVIFDRVTICDRCAKREIQQIRKEELHQLCQTPYDNLLPGWGFILNNLLCNECHAAFASFLKPSNVT